MPCKHQRKNGYLFLPSELLDIILLLLAGNQSEWYDPTDVHVWTKDMHIQLQLCAYSFDISETLLKIRPGATDPDLDFVLDQIRSELSKCPNDTLEC